MNRADALKTAEDTVDRLTVPPVNSRGYTADGWRAPSLEERAKVILDFAAFLADEPEPQEQTAPLWGDS